MGALRSFDKLKVLKISALIPGYITHVAILDTVAGKVHLEHLQIDYLMKKVSTRKNVGIDIGSLSVSLREHFYESELERSFLFKREFDQYNE
mmetsp:Transcript_11608/g.13833  ORF Transcript_11608/g.13833 Transcript_11608/m.13833 type:complete len:92 (+) Transcript_11608:154-429(+)